MKENVPLIIIASVKEDKSSKISLGGCRMGKDKNDGVVDNLGRVYSGDAGASLTDHYQDFYVADGGVVPTSLGVNSSLLFLR